MVGVQGRPAWMVHKPVERLLHHLLCRLQSRSRHAERAGKLGTLNFSQFIYLPIYA
jgi:hypothetical protein